MKRRETEVLDYIRLKEINIIIDLWQKRLIEKRNTERGRWNALRMEKIGVMDKINGFFFHWVIPFYASKNP